MTTSPTAPGTTLTARRPEDLLAAVPVLLGFHPHDSLVLLTFGAARQFHARLDLPRTGAEIVDAVDVLLTPALREGVQAVAFVAYADADSALPARAASRALARRFTLAGIRVLDALRADGQRWFPLLPGRAGSAGRGRPYDLTSHAFTAQAVFEGRSVLGSRTELASTVGADPGGVAALRAVLPDAVACSADEAVRTVARHLATGAVPDAELASLLLGLGELSVRDEVWCAVTRALARDHVELWADAVRRAPEEVVGGAASVLAILAWRAGHGALAWCAVDRCLAADPGNTLAALVIDLLEEAVPPHVLEP